MIPFLILGMVAGVVTFVATPIVRWCVLKVGIVDHPSDRKVHANPTPTLGGLAIFIGIAAAGVAARFLPDEAIASTFVQSSQVLGIAAAATVVFVLGAVDDIRNLPAPVKLAGQVFASGILFLSGVKFQFVLIPGNYISLSDDVSVLITVVWLVATMNAVNLVDGLDGLAAGIVAIAGAAFFVYSYELFLERAVILPTAPLVAIIVVGAALGFLRHNFYPARIFMGDSGAMLLGLILGAATVSGVGSVLGEFHSTTADVFLGYFPLLIPLAVLAIPMLDAVFAVVRRARHGRNVFHADKEHVHHRLMDLGHGHRQAVIVMYVWTALAAGAGLAFTFLDRSDVIFALPVAVGAIVLYTLFPALTKYLQGRLAP